MSPTARMSSYLLIPTILITLVVTVGGSLILWDLWLEPFSVQPVGASQSVAGAPIVIGIGRTPGGSAEWITFAKVFARVQRDLQRPVVISYIPDCDDSVLLIEAEVIDVAVVCSRTYLQGARSDSFDMLAVPVIGGRSTDTAVMVVAESSDVRWLEDLRGAQVVLTRGSLAARPFASWLLGQVGERPDDFFSVVMEAEAQEEALEAVAEGQADATFVRRSALAGWSSDGFRVVAESPDLGMPPIIAGRSLDTETVERMRESILSAREGGAIPVTSVIQDFVVPSEDDFEFAYELQRLSQGEDHAE